jgi:Cyclic-phosphate processing Receiver domain
MKMISVPVGACVLVADDSIERRHWFLSRYRLPHAYLAANSDQAIKIVEQVKPSIVFLDYDLGPGVSSEPVARFLAESNYVGQVYIHSENPFGREVLKRMFPAAAVIPYGSFEIVTTQRSAYPVGS